MNTTDWLNLGFIMKIMRYEITIEEGAGRGNRCLMGSMEPNIAIYVPWTRLYCSYTSYPPPPSLFYKYFHIQRSYFRFGDCNSDLPLTRPFPIQVLSEFVIVPAQVGELPRPPPPTSQDSTGIGSKLGKAPSYSYKGSFI